jgi:hypothetical protein
MSIYNPIIQGTYVPLVSAVRAATQILTRDQIILGLTIPNNSLNPSAAAEIPEASGIIAYLNVTAVPGIDTVQLSLEEQDPASGTWTAVAASSPTAAIGMVRVKLKPAITPVAASATGMTVQDSMPANWRVRVVHSAASNFTYSRIRK